MRGVCIDTCVHKRTTAEHVPAVALPPTKPIYPVLSHFCVIFWDSSLMICTYGASFIDESQLGRLPAHP